MGKKATYQAGKNKKGEKELQPATRTETINLHRRLYKATFKNKAPRAINQIREHAKRVMFTNDIRIDPELNQAIWANGIRNLDRRVDVVLERKKNEDDEESTEKMFTVVRLAK